MAGNTDGDGVKSFIHGMETSTRRLKSNFDAIFEKYNKPFSKNDVINLSTLTIVTDTGSVRRISGSNTFGASKLQSTKKKDELLWKRLGRQDDNFDPNVSMAIERRCVSYLNNSNAEEEQDDDLSDAETLTSDSSEDEDEYDNEDHCDEVDGQAVEEMEDATSSRSITDENRFSEQDEDCGNESDYDSFDSAEDSVEQKYTSKADNTHFSTICEAENKTSIVNRRRHCNEKDFSRKQPASRNDSVNTDLSSFPTNASIYSNSQTGLQSQHSPLNTSITSSLSNLSFVSIQSPTRNRSHETSARKIYTSRLLERKKYSDSTFSLTSNTTQKKNSECCPENSYLESFKSPAKVQDFNHVRSLRFSSSPMIRQSSKINLCRKQFTKGTLSSGNSLLDTTVTLSSKCDPNKEMSPKQKIECSNATGERFAVPSSPISKQNLNNPDSVFKSPQGIKVKRICPVSIGDRKHKEAHIGQMNNPLLKNNNNSTAKKKSLNNVKCGSQLNSVNTESKQTLVSQSTNSLHKVKKHSGLSVSCHTEETHLSSTLDLEKSHSLSVSDCLSHSNSPNLPGSETFNIDATFNPIDEESDGGAFGRSGNLLKSLQRDSWGLVSSSPHKAQNTFQSVSKNDSHVKGFCSPQKNSRVFSCGKRQMYSLSCKMSCSDNNFLGDLSMTSSFRNLDIHSEQLSGHCGESQFETESSHKRQLSDFGRNTCSQFSRDCCAEPNQQIVDKKYENRVAYDHSASSSCNTKHLGWTLNPPHVFGTSFAPLGMCQCACSLHTNYGEEQQKPLSRYGFDQRKWVLPEQQLTSSKTGQSEMSASGRIKRKASGSLTSGYFSEASASPKYVKNGIGSSGESPLVNNATFSLTENSQEPCHALNNLAHQNRDISDKSGHHRSSNSENVIEKPLVKINLNTFKRRLAKKKQQHISNDETCQNIRENPFSLQPKQQQLLKQSPATSDLRVSQWVEAACAIENSNANLPYHFASCPPKIVPSFRNHFSTGPSELLMPCHTVALQTDVSENQSPVSPVFTSSDKKDIGIQTSPNDIPTNKTRKLVENEASFPYNVKLSSDEHRPHSSHLETNLRCSTTKQILSPSKLTCSFNSHQPFSASADTKTSSEARRTCSRCEKCFSYLDTSKRLSGKTLSCWRDPEVEMSAEEDQEEGPNFSNVSNNQPIVESRQILCQREDMQQKEDFPHADETLVSADQNVSIIRPKYESPKLNRFVSDGLNQTIVRSKITRSFIETHSPRPKLSEPKGAIRNSSLTSIKSPENQAVMFPPSYINKFSPNNPHRIDSDATSFQYEKNKTTQVFSLRNCLKSFQPRRHNKSKSVGHTNCETKSHPPIIVSTASMCMNKPIKRRKIVNTPPLSPPSLCTNRPTSSSQQRQDLEYSRKTSNPTSLKTQKRFLVYSNKDRTSIPSVVAFPSSMRERASTPVRSLHKIPDLQLDETLSTIIDPVDLNDANERSDDEDTIVVGDSASDSNSSSEIDLL